MQTILNWCGIFHFVHFKNNGYGAEQQKKPLTAPSYIYMKINENSWKVIIQDQIAYNLFRVS